MAKNRRRFRASQSFPGEGVAMGRFGSRGRRLVRQAVRAAGWTLQWTVAGLALLAVPALAAPASFTGTFAQDDSMQSFLLSLSAPSDLTLRTWSYAGGTNAAGSAIPAGGFDPIVSLFSLPAGSIVGISDQGIGVAADPSTGSESDSLLELSG